jgi:hypothetical protein
VSADGESGRKLENYVISILAGPIGERRVAAWNRRRRRAVHEASHAVVAAMVGLHAGETSIVGKPEVKVGKGHVAGFATIRLHPPQKNEPPDASLPWPTEVRPDHRKAAGYASVLAPVMGWPVGWRGLLSYVRHLQAITRELVDRHWMRIATIAALLEALSYLEADEIAALMKTTDLLGEDRLILAPEEAEEFVAAARREGRNADPILPGACVTGNEETKYADADVA